MKAFKTNYEGSKPVDVEITDGGVDDITIHTSNNKIMIRELENGDLEITQLNSGIGELIVKPMFSNQIIIKVIPSN